jgi:predicted dehydrogenase
MAAMALGKHVQCQKPLTHTVFEARQMQLAAAKHRVVTQMGNQIQSHRFYRNAVKLVRDGAIGKVREVHSWINGAFQIKTDGRPEAGDPVPSTVHWDLWLGCAAERPYKKDVYHPFNWRAWLNFGSGRLGDFGCHILDPVFMALGLTAPSSVVAESPPINHAMWTHRSKVSYVFPGTDRTAESVVPLTWYDGDDNPPPHAHLGVPSSYELPNAGSALVGTQGTLVIPHVAEPKLFPVEKYQNITFTEEDRNHYISWVHACLGDGETTSHFNYASPLTETVLLGLIAIRRSGEKLVWNPDKLVIENSQEANAMLKKQYRRGWEPAWV